MLNQIKKGQESAVFMNAKLNLIGFTQREMENAENPENPIKWCELLLGHGVNCCKFNAPFDCGVEALEMYKEYTFAFSVDEKSKRLRVIGIFTPEYLESLKKKESK